MCGIFALLNVYKNNLIFNSYVEEEFEKGKNRGPEFSKLDNSYIKMTLGFHRLAINGLNQESNQPLVIDDIVLICNGEIYNYKTLYKYIGVQPKTGSDCEIIIHLYKKYGIEQMLTMLDGVFSFVLFDNRIQLNTPISNKVYVARDPLGVRPLYYLKQQMYYNTFYGFASEMKCINNFHRGAECDLNINIKQFTPGTYSVFNLSDKVNSVWEPIIEFKPYFNLGAPQSVFTNFEKSNFVFDANIKNISLFLENAVNKRCFTTERPIACLLSGGLDSSLITALVNNYYKLNNIEQKLETYSIGLHGSEDLKHAKIVADYLGTNHTEIIVTEKEMFETIPELIYALESYDTTTVRASIGNYLLGKYISQHSEAKVIFNGDGSDELCGGYLYMNHCPDSIEFDKETRRLLTDIHLFDVLRSDKCISSHGLEPRTPFLDKNFVQFYISLPINHRFHKQNGHCEKYLLRRSFCQDTFTDYEGKQLLPDEILWRRKEAFSDGVSNHGRSLYTILQEHIFNYLTKNPPNTSIKFSANIETEKYYYKSLFDKHFSNVQDILPYYWMPKYTNATDPSARTLDIYNS
jgi:asparagine synthase (glutamine-hydrolysing)